jgi:hypothetical protein
MVVLQDRLQGLAIPHERFRVEATRMVVTSLRKQWVVLLAPVVVVSSDHLAPSHAISVAMHVIARKLPC